MRQMPEQVAFESENHELVGVVGFPFEEVYGRLDRGLTAAELEPHASAELAADGLREVLAWAWLCSSPASTMVIPTCG